MENYAMRILLSLSLLSLASLAIWAADKAEPKGRPVRVVALTRKEPVDYDRDIVPIFTAKCLVCHSGAIKKGKLDLSTHESLMRGGRDGRPVVVPRGVADSLLVKLAARTMPPDDSKLAPLTPEELALLKLWIDQGARGPSGKDGQVRIVLKPLSPAVHPVRAIALGPDKTSLVVGRGNQIHLYNVAVKTFVRSLRDSSAPAALVEALAFSPDGKWLASGGFQEAVLWDTRTGAVLRKLTGFADRVTALSFSPDGKQLAAGGGAAGADGEIKLFEASTGRLLKDIKHGHSDTVLGICFSPDGKLLATCAADQLVKVFEVPGGKLGRTFSGHTHHVLDVSWKADGKLLASAGADKVVKVWDYEKGELLRTLPDPSVKGVKRGPSFQKEVSRLRFLGATAEVVACSGDHSVRVWNVETGEFVRQHVGAEGFLHSLGVSPDGGVLAAGGEEGIVWIWSGAAPWRLPLPPSPSARGMKP
jgi:WD40 repeat protein